MGNNIELKYENLSGIISNLKAANTSLENARKVLGESTDTGSSIMQEFWKFGNKEAIFGAIKSARSNIKYQTEENEKLIGLLNSIDDIYENAGKSAANSNAVSMITAILGHLSFVALSITYPAVFAGVAAAWAASVIKPYVSSQSVNTASTVPIIATTGFTQITGSVQQVINNTTAQQISQDIDLKAGQCLNDIWQNWGAVSPNGFTNYNGKGNCTWYADNRWSQKNPGNPLTFTTGSGRNAKNWINAIDKNKFNVLSTSDTNNIKANAIAVSQSGTYGHVAYIEQVKDGMVYYTEDGESYTRPHTWQKDSNGNWVGPTVQCCSLAEFKNKFGNVITSK
ncbi:MAG: CHAP domain-containing protein [Eubacterium sp.]|nr:CHAP domain-containing protein [Eubacterium sp.]